jgi:hypothetical protein
MENYLEINFEKNMKMLSEAIKCSEDNYSHNDIIDVLKGDDDIKKQFCLIELNKIDSQEEANILVFNLTNHSGPIRETSAFKIGDLISNIEYKKYFQTKEIIDTFVKAITDINPSVSRYSIDFIKFVDDVEYLYKRIIEEIKITLSNIDETVKNRSYVQNKKNFNLYWNLEAIIAIADKITLQEELIEILEKTALSNDYTIREKTAKTASLLNVQSVLTLLKDDENVYVRKYID